MASDFMRSAQAEAGKAYFRDHPYSSYMTAARIARKQYSAVLYRELFMCGWNNAFWDEQERVLKASRCKV